MLIGCLGMIISHLIVQTRDKFLSVLYPGATGDVPVLSSTCLQRLSVGGTVRGVIVGDLTRDSGRDGEHHVGSFSNLHLLLVHLCIVVEIYSIVYGLFFFSLYVFCCSMSKPQGSLHCTVVFWNYKLTLYIYRKHCKSVFCFITQSSAFPFISFIKANSLLRSTIRTECTDPAVRTMQVSVKPFPKHTCFLSLSMFIHASFFPKNRM